MKRSSYQNVALGAAIAFVAAAICLFGSPAASAMGTATIQQRNGHTDVYHDVVIKVIHNALYMTSADGRGTLVINRAACSYQGELLVCFATGATLVQSGQTSSLDFQRGTLYVNSTNDDQQLSLSTTKVPAHGILLSFSTKIGTYVSLSGTIDKVVK